MYIVAFGCSNTDCEGLKGWLVDGKEAIKPIKLACPQLLGNMLDRNVVNNSKPGCSNKYIEYSVLENEHIKENDIVVILWTYYDRTTIYNEDKIPYRILPSDLRPEKGVVPNANLKNTKFYYENMHSNFDSWRDFYTRLNNVRDYLDSKKIKNYHFSCEKEHPYVEKTPKWNRVNLHNTPFVKGMPLALDNNHPGEESHKKLADIMYNVINT